MATSEVATFELRGEPVAGTQFSLPARAFTQWTPERVDRAIIDADTGNLTTSADLSENLLNDDRVQGVMSTRTHGFLGLPLTFTGDAAMVEALEGPEDMPGDFWTMFPEAELARLIAWGLMLGVGVGQLVRVREREAGQREVPMLRAWHPRWLRQEVVTSDQPERWFLTTSTGEIEINPGDGTWVLFTPFGVDRPWSMAAWRPLAFAWLVKQFAIHDRARHSEVLGSPIRVGTAPLGATQRQREAWTRSIKNLGRDTAMVLPDGYDLKLVEMVGRGFELYDQQIQWAEAATAVVLSGQLVTTSGTPGFSNGNIHENVKRDLIRFTAEALSSTLREQALRPWAMLNFGDPNGTPWPRWDITPPEDRKEAGDALRAFGDGVASADAALMRSGKRVDAETMAEKMSIPTLPVTPSTPPLPTQAPPTLEVPV